MGDKVAAGALLAQIENGDLRAAVSQKQAAHEKEQAKLSALLAGTRPEEIAVKEAAVAEAETKLAQAARAML